VEPGYPMGMGYKLLGYAAWRAGKWYVRRRARDSRRGLAIGAIVALVLAGVLTAPRARAARED
jgi:hypothetical protein